MGKEGVKVQYAMICHLVSLYKLTRQRLHRTSRSGLCLAGAAGLILAWTKPVDEPPQILWLLSDLGQ